MRHRFSQATLGLLVFATCSCTFSPAERRATVRVPESDLPRLTPNGRLAYDCYAVSITGPGVSPTASSEDLGSYSPNCLEWGIYSNLASAEQMARGVRLALPAGVQRTVKVFGVVSRKLGAACAGLPATALFENAAVPELYPLAEAKSVSLLTDAKLELTRTTAVGSEKNILNSCFVESPPNGVPPNSVTGVKLAAMYLGGSFLDVFNLDLDNGQLALDHSLPLSFESNSIMAVSPDSRRMIVTDPQTGGHFQFLVDQDVLTQVSDGISNSALVNRTSVFFSADSRNAYFVGPSNTFFTEAAAGAYENISPGSGGSSWGVQTFVRGGNFFSLINEAGLWTIVFAPFISTWTNSFLLISTGVSMSSSEVRKGSIVTSQGVYLLYRASGNIFFVRYATFDGGGNMSFRGSPVTLGAATPDNVFIALAPEQKFLFASVGDGMSSSILSFPVDANGVPALSPSATEPADTGAISLMMDPSSRYLISTAAPGGASVIRSYSVAPENGQLTEVSSFSGPGISLNLFGAAVLYTQ